MEQAILLQGNGHYYSTKTMYKQCQNQVNKYKNKQNK